MDGERKKRRGGGACEGQDGGRRVKTSYKPKHLISFGEEEGSEKMDANQGRASREEQPPNLKVHPGEIALGPSNQSGGVFGGGCGGVVGWL